jgi:hypothetical protein
MSGPASALLLLAALCLGLTPSLRADAPCDLYAAAHTPCVAAHSTTRALFAAYNGPLYQVQRASDGAILDVGLLSDGYANAAAQDSFCTGTACTITKIYDQSSYHNDLAIAPPGGQAQGAGPGGYDLGAPADALAVTAGGHQVYGVEISAGMGYRNNATAGVAVNGQPEGMYMVTSGTHFDGDGSTNHGCCFDYGNAETNSRDNGSAHMDAINFSQACPQSNQCTGSGPWVQADMENGLYPLIAYAPTTSNANVGPLPYVTAMLKNDGQTSYTVKWGDATSGGLNTTYSGALPAGYAPMHQEGAIILGIGGDNSNWSIGSFFEGVMTAGVPSDATDNAVQANIVSVGYGAPTGETGSLAPGSEISLNATTPCCTADYIRHQNGGAVLSAISPASPLLDRQDATWIVRRGLADSSCISLESRNYPGDYLRHQDGVVYRQPFDGTSQMRSDATFCAAPGLSGQGNSFQSVNYTTNYIRHYNGTVYIASDGGPDAWDTATSWAEDASFLVTAALAP